MIDLSGNRMPFTEGSFRVSGYLSFYLSVIFLLLLLILAEMLS